MQWVRQEDGKYGQEDGKYVRKTQAIPGRLIQAGSWLGCLTYIFKNQPFPQLCWLKSSHSEPFRTLGSPGELFKQYWAPPQTREVRIPEGGGIQGFKSSLGTDSLVELVK